MAECSKCGRCCEYIFAEMPPKEMLKYWALHGNGYESCLFFPEHNVMLIPLRCAWLRVDNTCAYYADRPAFCRQDNMPLNVRKALRCSMI